MLSVLMWGLFTFAFGGMLLILVLGARRIEDELKVRAREAQESRADVACIPRFFVVSPPPNRGVGRFDEAALARLQQYLDAEQVLADEFVLQPSIESLYRDSAHRLTVH